jgi:uncharacterized protein (TIGR00369 family)
MSKVYGSRVGVLEFRNILKQVCFAAPDTIRDNTEMMLEAIRRKLAEGMQFPISEFLGMKVESVDAGAAAATLLVEEKHYNPFGTLHGGVYCDLADLAMGTAFMTTLEPGEGLATVELKINFFRPIRAQKLTAQAKVIHRGKATGYVECEVFDAEGRLAAKANSTCMVVRDERAALIAGKLVGQS